ncbi:MAG: hypothetical protein WCI94_22095 [Rhodospirillales bacterium]
MQKFLCLVAIAALMAIAAPASARPSTAPIVEDLYGFIVNTDAGTFDGAALVVAVRAMADTALESAGTMAAVAQAD